MECSQIGASNRQRVNQQLQIKEIEMRKVLIIVLGLASIGTLAAVHQASAASNCRIVCDQWGPDNWGKQRCLSARQVCKPAMNSAPQSIQDQKRKREK